MKRFLLVLLVFMTSLFSSCKSGEDDHTLLLLALLFYMDQNPSPVACSGCYDPAVSDTWQLQLTGTVNTSYAVDLYDIDMFDTSVSKIESLHTQGTHVICYFSAGSAENWRSDYDSFPSSVLGNDLDGWPGEKWVDIRSSKVLSIMKKRLDLAVEKGCDGVDPDNVNGYLNNTGFPLTASNQLYFNKHIANEAHKRGLFVALKNSGEQAAELEPFYDLDVNEQCNFYSECNLYNSFINAGKPLLNVEYDDAYVNNTAGARDDLCTSSRSKNIRTLVLPLLLDDSFRYTCD